MINSGEAFENGVSIDDYANTHEELRQAILMNK
jgi:hypothetical protein